MKFNQITSLFAVLALLCSSGFAQEQSTQKQEQSDSDRAREVFKAGQADGKTVGANIRASRMMGMSIQNSKEQSLGEISDLVIDARKGEVVYAAVTYGGFLGVGNDLHAVPFKAFSFKTDPDDSENIILVLDVTKEMVENSNGFNESTWPARADEAFKDLVKESGSAKRSDEQESKDEGQEKTTNKQRIQDEGDNRNDPTRAGSLDGRTTGMKIRASQLIGMGIENMEQKDVGSISDLVINAREGKVSYAAVTYGGFAGFANTMHAVPFNAFKFMEDPDDENASVLALDVTQEKLEGAEGFNEENWPNFGDKSFTEAVDLRYGFDEEKDKDDDKDSDDQKEKSAGKNKIDK